MIGHSPPKLPVYFLLDASDDMAGEWVDALQIGIQRMVRKIVRLDLSPVMIGAIVFGGYGRYVLPLTSPAELARSGLPAVVPGGARTLGDALRILAQAINREVRPAAGTFPGDFKPLIFLLMSGAPSDTWEGQAQVFKQHMRSKRLNLVAIAYDDWEEAPATLRRITDVVLLFRQGTSGAMDELFAWIGDSIKAAEAAVTSSGKGQVPLPAPPSVLRVAGDDSES